MTAIALREEHFDLAAHPGRISPLLAAFLPGRAAVEQAELLGQKEGRALFRYRLCLPDEASPSGSGPAGEVLAKLYADQAQAARVYATMRALNDRVFPPGSGLAVPRPLGLVCDLGLLVYEPAVGTPLHEVHPFHTQLRAARDAGRWLAVLHGCGLEQDRRLDPAKEAANAALWAATVDRELGASATRASRLADRLVALGRRLEVDQGTVIHKDFHHEHVLVGPTLAVVDLDEVRRGDPAFDVSHFCANLRLLHLRGAVEAGVHDGLRDAFVDEYSERTGWRPDGRFDFFSALHGVKLAKQMATGRGPGPRPTGAERARQASVVVEEALAWLP